MLLVKISCLLVLTISSTYNTSNYKPKEILNKVSGLYSKKANIDYSTLILNGTGVRKKYWIDLYEGKLYLKNKCQDGEKISLDNEVMAINIRVISDLMTTKRLEEALMSEFDRITRGLSEIFHDRLNILIKAFGHVINKNETLDLYYLPEEGLRVYKNKELKCTIPGLNFKQILFGSWLGHDPADINMKKGMLGI